MKNVLFSLLLLAAALAPVRVLGQNASATWALGSGTAAATTGNVVAAPQILSGGVPPISVFDYTSDGQRLYAGSNGWTAAPPASDRFVQFDMAVLPGFNFQVGSVSFNYGASVRVNSMASEVWYSTNGWATRTQLNSSALAYPNASMSAFQASPSVTVPSGGVFSVRIYPYALLTQVVTSPQFAVHNTVVINGTTTPVVSCSACLTPPSNLVAWWAGDNNANDLSSNANHGTLQGAATYAPGKVGNAFSFAANADYVSVPDHAALNAGTGDFSMDAWIRTTSSSQMFVVSKTSGPSGSTVGYYFQISGGFFAYGLHDGTHNFAGGAITNVTLNDGQWHLLAATVQRGTPTTISLYVDGQFIATGTATNTNNPTGSLTNTGPLLIGQSQYITGLGFKGEIDELELFDRALTASEITALYNAGANGKCKPPSTAREGEPTPAPRSAMLEVARPNPFSNLTRIGYVLPASGPVRLDVFDLLGRRVATVVNDTQAAGQHETVFDGSLLPPGTYVYRIETAGRTESRTVVVLR